MGQERPNSLLLCHVQRERLDAIDITGLMREFVGEENVKQFSSKFEILVKIDGYSKFRKFLSSSSSSSSSSYSNFIASPPDFVTKIRLCWE